MKLILFTALSRTFLDLALETINREATVVVDTSDAVRAELKQVGISSVPLRAPGAASWAERDTAFAQVGMPGNLDLPIPGTHLPAWKVLSLDRLSFWFRPEALREYELVQALRWESALVSADIDHPLPWTLARARKVTGVQVQPIRTREWLALLATGLPFRDFVAWNAADSAFLSRFGIAHTVRDCGDFSYGAAVQPEERQSARAALKLPTGARVALVLFEAQTEWEFRTALPQLLGQYAYLLVYPVARSDRRHLDDIGLTSSEHVRLVDDLGVEAAADEVVLFRYHPALLYGRRVPVQMFDITGRWNTPELGG